jgi:transcriptional regulator with XRE-family HTH domain
MKHSNIEVQRAKLYALLKEFRLEKGIRQVELAEKLGVPQSFVSKYESGDRRLDTLELRQVCNAIGISLQEFIQELENRLNEAE